MPVELKIVSSKSELKTFIYFPEKVHAMHQNWVPPIYADEFQFYDPKHNPQLADADTILFLAYKNGEIAGRIMGIIHKAYNALHHEKTARFFNLECFDDYEVARTLIAAIENWARQKGMNGIIGPFGFSDKDPQGIQIAGFEHLPVLATPTNLPYLQKLIEQMGYIKERDCLVYKLNIPKQIPDFYQRVYNRVSRNSKHKLIEFKTRRQLKPYIVPVFRLVNETYKSIYGFIPMNEKEMHSLADKYIPMLDPAFTKLIVDENNNPTAFVVASPDISMGIKLAKGKIFPIGFIHFLLSAKRTKQLDLFLGAVKDDLQGSGLTTLLGVSLFKSANQRGLEYIDSHLILETNKQMRAVMERLGATVYKRYRIYSKAI